MTVPRVGPRGGRQRVSRQAGRSNRRPAPAKSRSAIDTVDPPRLPPSAARRSSMGFADDAELGVGRITQPPARPKCQTVETRSLVAHQVGVGARRQRDGGSAFAPGLRPITHQTPGRPPAWRRPDRPCRRAQAFRPFLARQLADVGSELFRSCRTRWRTGWSVARPAPAEPRGCGRRSR